jgi:23S rRNA A1618 N6-methylase RlmF
MACGGLKFIEKDLSARFNKNFTQRVVELAIEMMKYIHGTTFTYGIKLSLKIGVHYGSCIYGVIGYHKPQFSLIGDTVNTTSRHCTTGENGTIVLSMAAKNKIDISQIAHFKTALVEMKGKGKVEVFMILPPKKNIISLEHIRDASGSIMDNTSNKIFMHSSGKRRATLGNQKTNELVTPRGGNAVTIEPFMEKVTMVGSHYSRKILALKI